MSATPNPKSQDTAAGVALTCCPSGGRHGVCKHYEDHAATRDAHLRDAVLAAIGEMNHEYVCDYFDYNKEEDCDCNKSMLRTAVTAIFGGAK